MLEAQITSTESLIARSWATLRNRSLPEEQLISSAQIEGWRTSAQRLIAQMFGHGSEQSQRFEDLYLVRRVELLNYHSGRRDRDWDILYWIDFFELCKSFFLEIDAAYKIANATPVKMEVFMGPKYEVKQAGVVGESNTVTGNTFQQVWSEAKGDIDIGKLAEELAQLRVALKAEPTPAQDEGDQDVAVGAVKLAENEARKGDGPAALAALKHAGKWALSVAEKIGLEVAIAAIKSGLGLGL